ncbi:hypothetical protein K440DRAFT_687243 [Wilcoxina mikolae CBS 423.85]|nr:hypothetical protein K440DRAFT_687243 [Wilcoxina mikolae CBS 423.85]
MILPGTTDSQITVPGGPTDTGTLIDTGTLLVPTDITSATDIASATDTGTATTAETTDTWFPSAISRINGPLMPVPTDVFSTNFDGLISSGPGYSISTKTATATLSILSTTTETSIPTSAAPVISKVYEIKLSIGAPRPRLSQGAIAGISLGSVFAVFLVVAFIIWRIKKGRDSVPPGSVEHAAPVENVVYIEEPKPEELPSPTSPTTEPRELPANVSTPPP